VLGIAAYNMGNLAEAHQTLSKSMEIWQSVGDPRGQCYCYLHLALVTFALNEISETQSILGESNQIAAVNEDWWSYAFGLDILGMVSMSQGKNEDALAYFEQSKARMSEIGDRFALLHIIVHIGQAHAALGSFEHAKQLLLNAYAEARQAKWTPIILNVLVSFIEIEDQLSAATRLAVALSVLSNPGIDPNLHNRAKRIRDENRTGLPPSEIDLAEKMAQEKSAEEWAEQILNSSSKPY
jgi:tetratricopeptide (TPR) repeat protein